MINKPRVFFVIMMLGCLTVVGCEKKQQEDKANEVELQNMYSWMQDDGSSTITKETDDLNNDNKVGTVDILISGSTEDEGIDSIENPIAGKLHIKNVQVMGKNVNIDKEYLNRIPDYAVDESGNIIDNPYGDIFVKVEIVISCEKDCIGAIGNFCLYLKEEGKVVGLCQCIYHDGELASNDVVNYGNLVKLNAKEDNIVTLGFLCPSSFVDCDEIYLVPTFGDYEGRTVEKLQITNFEME